MSRPRKDAMYLQWRTPHYKEVPHRQMRRGLKAAEGLGARCCLFVDGLNSELVSDGSLEMHQVIVVTDRHALAAHEYWHLVP